MSPSEDMPGESFRGLVLRLRGRTGLTQRELATRIGVHVGSIQGWEAGTTYPGVASLQALIATGMQAGGFTAGREREEAQALWAAALRNAPRLRTPFDGAWFERLAAVQRRSVQDEAEPTVAAPSSPSNTTTSTRRESWGEAPDIAGFLNRTSEREMLRQWVLDEGSRLVAVLGLGGIGKSLLATRLARDVAPSFERIFWRSLRDAPTPDEWLAEALGFLAPEDAHEPGGETALVRRLLERLGETRCLLVLDNVETILQPGDPIGAYRAGYERYGMLLRQVADAPHRSCLVVTSREEPAELGRLRGVRGPVRALELAGFGSDDGRALLHDKQLDGDERAWRLLVERYGGNCLALKVVGETTRELFGGSVADYLEFAAAMSGAMVGGVRQLLQVQVQRLSHLEQELLRRMAVEREPVGLMELATGLGPRFGGGAVLEAVEGLRRRSLLERTERGPRFSLNSVVLEYVTEQLIDEVAHEMVIGEPDRLLRQPLLKATAKEYVRRSQERLVCAPLVERLAETCGSVQAAEERLVSLLDMQRGRPVEDQGYGPGNIVNLLRLLRGDLKGVDLSGLSIRHAYLQDVEAHGASLAGAYLSEAVLGEAFSYPTSSLALSDDGAYLAVGTSTGQICRWRVADRTLLATLIGHTGAINSIAVSEDGHLIVSGGADGMVRLWEAGGGRPQVTLHGHTGAILCVAASGDGHLVVSGGTDGMVRLWEAESGRPLTTLHGHIGAVICVAASGDGHLVVSGGEDGTVRLWEGEDGRPLATLHGHNGAIWGVALSRDGRQIASGSIDGTVRVWEVASGRPVAVLQGHSGGVRGVALSGDGRLVASSSVDGTVRLWEVERGLPRTTLYGHTAGVRGVALSRDGRLVASSSVDGTVRLWEAEGGRPLAVLRGHDAGIVGVALSQDGRLVASGDCDGNVRLREARGNRSLTTLQGHVGGVRGVAVSGDGRLVVSGGLDGTVRLWDANGGRLLTTLKGHSGIVVGVACDGDGRLIASGGVDGTVRLWEGRSGRSVAVFSGHASGVWSVAVSSDGRLVASGGYDGTVRLWVRERGGSLATLRGHSGAVRAVGLSRDGRLVVSGGFDGAVRVWETEGGRPLATFQEHTGMVYGVALNENGQLMASGSADGTVRLWETEGGRALATLRGHTGEVFSVALSADGGVIASAGQDGTVRLWAPSTGACLRVLRDDRRYERVDISGLTGITDAQRGTLLTLGAVERRGITTPSV